MPISASCPSCSASFKVKDELAGKRIKCPKCGETMVIPSAFDAEDTVKVPPPAAKTAPRAVAKPQPVEDEADEAPKPKRRRDDDEDVDEKPKARRQRDEDAEEESPKSKRRRDDDSPKKRRGEDDDKPRSRRRSRDDDDDKPKKKSALPLILGILGGVVVLCGGGCAGVWFGVIAPAAAKAKASNDALQKEIDDALNKQSGGSGQSPATANLPKSTGPTTNPTEPSPKPTEPSPKPDTGVENKTLNKLNLSKLDSSYTLEKVEAIFGKGQLADVATVTADAANVRTLTTDGIAKYSDAQKALLAEYAKRGLVYRWDNKADRALVVFRQLEAGGGMTEVIHTELGIATKLRAVIMPLQEVVAVKAEDLAAEFDRDEKAADAKYRDKLLTVSGTVTEVKTGFTDGVILKGVTGKERTVGVQVGMPVTDKKAGVKPGDAVTYYCEYVLLSRGFKSWHVELRNGYRVTTGSK